MLKFFHKRFSLDKISFGYIHFKTKKNHHPINIGLVIIVILASMITWFLTEYIVYELNEMDLAAVSWVSEARPWVKAAGEIHYVAQNAAGDGSGSSYVNHMGVATFNSASKWSTAANSNDNLIGPSDTVYFSGALSIALAPQGSGSPGNPITLDGYEPDDTTFMYLSESPGRAKIDANGENGIDLEGRSFIRVFDFEITGCGKYNGIMNYNGAHDNIIQRNFIYECDSGIDNVRPDVYNIIIGGESGQGNVVKNVGTGTDDEDISICSAYDIIISYNHLYADDPDWGIDGITPTCGNSYDILIEYNLIHGHNKITDYSSGDGMTDLTGEDGIDLKDQTRNVIIRYNKIYDHYRWPDDYDDSSGIFGININSGGDNVYIYGNWFENNQGGGIYFSNRDDHENVYIFSNIFVENQWVGMADSAASSDTTHYIYNNIFSRNTYPAGAVSSGRANLRITTGTEVQAKNNIFYKSRPTASDYQQIYIYGSSVDNTYLDYNQYYWPSYQSIVYWGDAGGRTLSQLKSGSGNGLPQEIHGSEGNPGLVDIEGNNFTVSSADSAVVNSGITMGEGDIAVLNIHGTDYPVRWDAALHPLTNWSTIPISVVPANQTDYGAWERGAYVYTGGAPSTCLSRGGFCCTGSQVCSGTTLGTYSDCPGVCCGAACQNQTQDCRGYLVNPQLKSITYTDVAPAGYVMEDNYGGLGADSGGWIYHCVDGYYSGVGIEDTAVFRYNSTTGAKQFLGTMRAITQAEGNLDTGEEIAKIHAPVIEYNGKMYFASHSFHSADEIQRGGHFYSFDLAAKTWTDLSKHDSGGVSAPGQGIIAMDILRNHNKLAGFTYPKGEIITYDLTAKRTANHGRPISSDPRNVARHILATNAGKVYFSYASYDTPLWVFDVNTGAFSSTGQTLHYGWLAGGTVNKAGTKAYLLDWLGYLYSIDVNSGAIAEIGNIQVPEHSGYTFDYLHGLALSIDETRLYTAPVVKTGSGDFLGTYLYEYEIGSGQKRYLADIPELRGVDGYAIGTPRDSTGSLYYHSHDRANHTVQLFKFENDCDISPAACPDGTALNACSSSMGPPWYCGSTGQLAENCSICGCSGGWTCSAAGTYCSQSSGTGYQILKTDSPPAIDGQPGEYADANKITITNSRGTTGDYRFLYDSAALYVAAQVADSEPNAIHFDADGSLWEDDSIELFFDTLHNAGASLNADDYKAYVNLNNTHTDSQGRWDYSWTPDFTSAVNQTGSGYTIEFAIPWANWGISPPNAGNTWGFDLSLNDRDNAGAAMQTVWTNSDGGSANNPDGWGDMAFSSQSVPQQPEPASLSAGLHTITLTATDAEGNTTQDTIEIEILPENTLTAQINLLDTEYTQGDTIYFTSSVSGGTSPYTYAWKSDKQGTFSTAQWPTVDSSAWQTGTHNITLTVTDSASHTAADNITITINPDVLAVFKSGFESPVAMSGWLSGTNWYQETTGADQGYDWETDFIDTNSNWNIILNKSTYPDPDQCIGLDITSDEHHRGSNALYMEVKKSCKYNSVEARVSHSLGSTWPYDEAHFKAWLKIPSATKAVLRGDGGSINLNELRNPENPGGLRHVFEVFSDAGAQLRFRIWSELWRESGWQQHWLYIADNVTVPLDQWFQYEVYYRPRTYAQGGGAYWIKINGTKILEQVPTETKRICGASASDATCAKPFAWNMIKCYTYDYPVKIYLDDIELYDKYTP